MILKPDKRNGVVILDRSDYKSGVLKIISDSTKFKPINPFAPGDFAEKRVLKLVEWFSGHCRAIKSQNLPQTRLQVVHFTAF